MEIQARFWQVLFTNEVEYTEPQKYHRMTILGNIELTRNFSFSFAGESSIVEKCYNTTWCMKNEAQRLLIDYWCFFISV